MEKSPKCRGHERNRGKEIIPRPRLNSEVAIGPSRTASVCTVTVDRMKDARVQAVGTHPGENQAQKRKRTCNYAPLLTPRDTYSLTCAPSFHINALTLIFSGVLGKADFLCPLLFLAWES